mmetsp:Transcript_59575/g.98802  ORF Transcript_59575/g.98802 Transcript_59575/m.98802 type:complete len:96 (-) Transcript_59575:222-509(-)
MESWVALRASITSLVATVAAVGVEEKGWLLEAHWADVEKEPAAVGAACEVAPRSKLSLERPRSSLQGAEQDVKQTGLFREEGRKQWLSWIWVMLQ